MHNWQLSDFVSRLNIASSQRMKLTLVQATTLNLRLLTLFVEMGLIRGFHLADNGCFEVYLKLEAFSKITLVSKPSLKVYLNKIRYARFKERSDNVFYVFTTSKGVIWDSECFFSNIYGKALLKIQV